VSLIEPLHLGLLLFMDGWNDGWMDGWMDGWTEWMVWMGR